MQKNAGINTGPLRVLVVDGNHPPSDALARWLQGQADLAVKGPAPTVSAAFALAAGFEPQVILLDFHGLPVPVDHAVTLFKELRPVPFIFLLTHDDSPAMRRRSLVARVDAVFDKTAELALLLQALAVVREAPDASALEAMLGSTGN